MRRLLYVAALVGGLTLTGAAAAQPERGPMPRPMGPKAGPDSRRLEAELDRLSARLKDLEDRLGRAQRSDRPEPKAAPGDRDRRGPGFGGGFGRGPGDRFGGPGGRGFGPGFGPGPKGPDGGRGFGRGGSGGSSPDVARRLGRIIAELVQLKKDLQAPKR